MLISMIRGRVYLKGCSYKIARKIHQLGSFLVKLTATKYSYTLRIFFAFFYKSIIIDSHVVNKLMKVRSKDILKF